MSRFTHPSEWLPPPILALFEPGPPIEHWEPPRKKPHRPVSPTAPYVDAFEDPKTAPPPPKWEMPLSRLQKEDLRAKKQRERGEQLIREGLKKWDPHSNPKATGDVYKTLFVSRLNYKTTEDDLRREFEIYGPIKQVCLVRDINTGKSRGYAFIEYERVEDMKEAYKYADEKMIDGRRVKVDAERGRAEKSWRPRRLGGGLGGESRVARPSGAASAAAAAMAAASQSYRGGSYGDRSRRSSGGGGGRGGGYRGSSSRYGGDRYRPYGGGSRDSRDGYYGRGDSSSGSGYRRSSSGYRY